MAESETTPQDAQAHAETESQRFDGDVQRPYVNQGACL